MSLGIVIKSPEGIVLAAESRVTLTAANATGGSIHVNFDNATKLFNFNDPNGSIGVVTYGQAAIGGRTAHSYVPEFESTLLAGRQTVENFAGLLSTFYLQQWNTAMAGQPAYTGPNMTFIVSGFDEGAAYGKVFEFEIPRNPTPTEKNGGVKEFGIIWGGQREIVDRLIQGFDARVIPVLTTTLQLDATQQQAMKDALKQFQMPVPIQVMALQDCVNLALLFLRTTIDSQTLTVGIRGCGGPIDLAIIRRNEKLIFIRKKEITLI